MKSLRAVLLLIATLLSMELSRAEPPDVSANFKTTTILNGMDNPWGIAVRAERNTAGPQEIFVAESGAGRVIRLSTRLPEEFATVIDGFKTGTSTYDSQVQLGPLAMSWITRTKLAVTSANEQTVRVYALSGDEPALQMEDFEHVVQPGQASNVTGGGLGALVTNDTTAYFVSTGSSSEAGMFRADIAANRLKYLREFRQTSIGKTLTSPTGITTTPSGRPPFLVVAQQGEIGTTRDSRLVFYTQFNGTFALELETGLYDMMAVAYGPSGNLYAIDTAWSTPEAGGLYRLDDARLDGRQVCRAVRLASLIRPVGMAFDTNGKLYVTTLGDGATKAGGSLVQITGQF